MVRYSKPVVAGMNMRVDEINAEGGIHGRKLKLVVEDHGYDPKKAVLAPQKLVQNDKIFAMLGTIGTPRARGLDADPAGQERCTTSSRSRGARNLRAAAEVQVPGVRAVYRHRARALRYMVKQKGHKKVCILYQDDDFGLEVMRGAEAGVKEIGQTLCEKTTYKRGATDFSSQVRDMKDAGCDFVVLGTIIRETVGTIATARKLGWNVEFMGSSAAYDNNIPKFGQKAVEGFYAISVQAEPPVYATAKRALKQWIDAYKKAFNEDPTLFSTAGYTIIDVFARAAQKAGPNLTSDTLNAALEGLVVPRDYFGAPEYSFSKTNHLGNKRGKIAQIQNGNWVTLTDFISTRSGPESGFRGRRLAAPFYL